MLARSRKNDCYHRAFFYVMGIAPETKANIHQMFDFTHDWIEPEGMHGGWQSAAVFDSVAGLVLEEPAPTLPPDRTEETLDTVPVETKPQMTATTKSSVTGHLHMNQPTANAAGT